MDGGRTASLYGTIFELSSNARRTQWTETVLYRFCAQTNCTDGAGPEGELVMDASGNLFGTTSGGGSTQYGTVFKLVPNGTSSTETVLYNFCSRTVNCLDGGAPNSSVALDASGNIFGAATMGGGNNGNDSITGSGTLFELTQSKYSVLHRFCAKRFCNDGQFPLAGGDPGRRRQSLRHYQTGRQGPRRKRRPWRRHRLSVLAEGLTEQGNTPARASVPTAGIANNQSTDYCGGRAWISGGLSNA